MAAKNAHVFYAEPPFIDLKAKVAKEEGTQN